MLPRKCATMLKRSPAPAERLSSLLKTRQPRRHLPQDIVKGGLKTVSPSSSDGHPHHHDHRRQSADRRRHRPRSWCHDFLAEAKPKDKMDLIKREQAKGKLVAMTGDGTNDAPLLPSRRGRCDNSAPSCERSRNMVDLDSNPPSSLRLSKSENNY